VFLAATRGGHLVLCEQATLEIERDSLACWCSHPDPASPGPWVCPLTKVNGFSRRLRTAPLRRGAGRRGVALCVFGNSTGRWIMSNALGPVSPTGSPGKNRTYRGSMRISGRRFPWGEEAFAKAGAEQKPIFLSVGYSTAHWCHVNGA